MIPDPGRSRPAGGDQIPDPSRPAVISLQSPIPVGIIGSLGTENERREQEKEEKRRRKLELRDDDAHHERQMQWRRERRLRWDEEESTARRCQGVCVSGTQCRVYSCHPGAHAAPLKRGATFCLHHRKQTAVPMQLYMNGVGLDVEAVVHD